MGAEVVVCGKEGLSHMLAQLMPDSVLSHTFRDGTSCRESLVEEIGSALVLIGDSLDDVSPINLVAALRLDEGKINQHRRIVLVLGGEVSGSLKSRANVAGVDEIWSLASLSTTQVMRALGEISHACPVSTQIAPQPKAVSTGPVVACQKHIACHDELLDGLLEEPFPVSEAENVIPDRKESAAVPVASDYAAPKVKDTGPQSKAPSYSETWGEHDGSGGFVMAVTSGSGGVGKSTVALLSAIELADRGMACALVDLDLQFGDLPYLLGLCDYRTLDEYAGQLSSNLHTDVTVTSFATSIQSQVALFASPRKPELGDLVLPQLPAVFDALRSEYDAIVVNTGSFWGDAHVALMQQSDMCLMLMDQRISSVQASLRALGLIGCLGVPQVRTACILNRFDPHGSMNETDVSMALKGAKLHTLSDGGREVEELMGVGCPEELFALRNRFVTDLSGMLTSTLSPFGLLKDEKRHRRLIPEIRHVSSAGNVGEC